MTNRLLDTVEPDSTSPMIWLKRADISWARSGVANGMGQFSFVQRDGYDIPMTLFAPYKQNVKEIGDLRLKVESLLTECRKQTLLEAMGISEYYATNSVTARNIRDELRRMTEGEMK